MSLDSKTQGEINYYRQQINLYKENRARIQKIIDEYKSGNNPRVGGISNFSFQKSELTRSIEELNKIIDNLMRPTTEIIREVPPLPISIPTRPISNSSPISNIGAAITTLSPIWLIGGFLLFILIIRR